MAWSDIIGQQRVKDILKRLIESDRLPHAMLFYGPSGAGQEAAALELAKTLNCEKQRGYACGDCPTCRQFAGLRHPRLVLVFPLPSKQGETSAYDKMTAQELEEINEQIALKAANPYHQIAVPKASGIKVSSVRDILREGAFRSSGKGRTVVCIFDADKMNQNAANALLKSLEEPTGDLMFILSTSERDAVLPTIRSRCQALRFEPLSEDDIIAGLRREGEFSDEKIKTCAQLAGGSYTAARSLLTEENMIEREEVREYLRQVVMYKPVELMNRLQHYASRDDRRQVTFFLSLVQLWFRDILAVREGAPQRVVNKDFLESLEKFAAHYPHADCNYAITLIENTIDMVNKNVHLMNALLVLSQRLRLAIIRQNASMHAERISR